MSPRTPLPTLEVALSRYHAHVRATTPHAPRTCRADLVALTDLKVFLHNRYHLARPDQVQARHLQAYLDELARQGRASAIPQRWRVLHAFFAFLAEQGLVAQNPTRALRPPDPWHGRRRPTAAPGPAAREAPVAAGPVAGLARLKQGEATVAVVFATAYPHAPSVTVSLTVDAPRDPQVQAAVAQAILQSNIRYIVIQRTTHGFVIKLNRPAPEDLQFSWTAFPIKEATT